jgi:predicted glycoside hydrolase/deacetylase ChbG (UPF0249 family)
MPPNKKRQLVIHVDDVGNSHGSNLAYEELFDLGAVTTGSVMVPCPWFPEIAAMARKRPDFDLGVHLTLSAEFVTFRCRPLTGVSDNGLTDADGFQWRDVASARKADPAAVEAELRAQIDAALAAGIDETHLDSHMGTVMMPEFVDIYVRLGEDYRLPIVLPRDTGLAGTPVGTHGDATRTRYATMIDALVARGTPDFATYISSNFGPPIETEPYYRGIFASAPEGLTWGAFHMTTPGDFGLFSPDAEMRADEYELFRSGGAREMLDELGIAPVGMRAFRDAMRAR